MLLESEVYYALIKSEEVRKKKNLYLRIIEAVAKATGVDVLNAMDQIESIEVNGTVYKPIMIECLRKVFYEVFEVPVRLRLRNGMTLISEGCSFTPRGKGITTTAIKFISTFKKK